MANIASGHKINHVFGDVGGVVADALEVLGHQDQLERRKNHARNLPSCR